MNHPNRLLDVDPQVAALIAAENRRQQEKIIMIPSESLTPPPVREAIGSVFTSIYAEGYPRRAMMQLSTEQLADTDAQLASYRRYADRRFYKGAEIADLIESVAIRRAAECFATKNVPAQQIHANVQALSGAAANLAVYEAFVRPGETVMGMALTEGGHLSHGSPFNVTGKRYNIVSYAVNPETGRLDYDEILRLAKAHRPKMIIGGFTSYPWQPDWTAFRRIADEVGAVLLADVAHTAGLIVGGAYPNPIESAHVVSFTTHKTLCGPRGAIILTTNPEIADRINTAIFPGQQGGPHVDKFAAIAVALKLAQQPEFSELQRQIVKNAAALSAALADNELQVAYGGTNTHLLLVDLRPIASDTGFVMMGEVASRILDLAGIVCNKNTLPGDQSAANAHGIRLGTPWATQRGMREPEMKEIARIISRLLHAIRPFSYPGLISPLSRGKLPINVLEEAKREVRSLLSHVDPGVLPLSNLQDPGDHGDPVLSIHGGRTCCLVDEALPSDMTGLSNGQRQPTFLFDEAGNTLSDAVVGRISPEWYVLYVPRENVRSVHAWLTGLAEGYTVFDSQDVFRKVQGPAVVERVDAATLNGIPEAWKHASVEKSGCRTIREAYARFPERFSRHKPYFVGQSILDEPTEDASPIRTFSWSPSPNEKLSRTSLHPAHVSLGAKLVAFAGWEMPVWYTSAGAEHRAVRERAGLFDLGHMGVFQVEGDGATDFLNAVTSNYAAWLEDGTSQYGYLFDPRGNILDDVMVYRRATNTYLVVVNAVNEAKDWEWLTGVNERRYTIDHDRPTCRLARTVKLRNLKAERGVVDIALQGPASPVVLSRLLDERGRWIVKSLRRTAFAELVLGNRQMLIARTGYTGEQQGYEIYVGGDAAVWLWNRLLELGNDMGLLPCGLAARDSTRTESGLPLYGHELGGQRGINPFEAGFSSYVKLHKPFFVGRAHCVAAYRETGRRIVRFSVESGVRPVRENAAVLDRNGSVLGAVTSCISIGDQQIGMALLEGRTPEPGTPILLQNPGREPEETGNRSQAYTVGSRISVPARGEIVPRFPPRTIVPEPGGE